MDRNLSLASFRVFCRGLIERDGFTIYDVRVECLRNGEWELSGLLNLRSEEWLRLLAVFQAHEVNRDKVSTD